MDDLKETVRASINTDGVTNKLHKKYAEHTYFMIFTPFY